MQLCIYVYTNKNSVEGHTFYEPLYYLFSSNYLLSSKYVIVFNSENTKSRKN